MARPCRDTQTFEQTRKERILIGIADQVERTPEGHVDVAFRALKEGLSEVFGDGAAVSVGFGQSIESLFAVHPEAKKRLHDPVAGSI